MLPLLTKEGINCLDQATIQAQGIESLTLMQRAIDSFVQWFISRYDTTKTISLFCGNGNNGADGLGIGLKLNELGYQITIYTLDTDKTTKEYQFQREKLEKNKQILHKIPADLTHLASTDIIIDALFGSGLSRPLEGVIKNLVEHLNKQNSIKVSVDVPSGMPVDTYFKGVFFKADELGTFQLPKFTFFIPEYTDAIKNIAVLDIGLDIDLIEENEIIGQLIQSEDFRYSLPKRAKTAHKGNFGHALLIAGKFDTMGACILAAKSAFRSGVALLTTVVPSGSESILYETVPESMLIIDQSTTCFTRVPELNKYSCIGIGPGLGISKETADALQVLLAHANKPMVIDADALNIISQHKSLLGLIPKESILTPHPKEFERLVGSYTNSIERLTLQIQLSKQYQLNVLVKGAHTTMTDSKGKVYVNITGNPGMATAGSGDVLTGILTGLLGKGMPAKEAMRYGVYLHGLAGDLAKSHHGEESMMASDIIAYIPEAIKTITLDLD